MERRRAHDLGWRVATAIDVVAVVAIGAALIAFLILMFAGSSSHGHG